MSKGFTGGFAGKLSLNVKILASLITALVLGLAATATLISQKSAATTEELSVQSGKNLANGIAAEVEVNLNAGIELTEALRDAFLGLQRQGIRDRQAYLSILERAMEANPHLVGVWTAWEPNAFDGRDAEFVNVDGNATFPSAKVHDASGRFVPYVFATPNGHDMTVLMDYDKPGAGDYYLLAQQSGKQQIIEPYAYEVDGKTMQITSLVTPVVIDGKVVGVTGVDLSLSAIQARLAEIKPYETGSVSLISAAGNWAAYKDPALVMKPIEEGNANMASAKAGIAKGEAFSEEEYSSSLQTNVIRAFQPVNIGDTGTPWSVMVNLPEDKILAPARELTWFTIGAAAALVLALSLIVTFLVRGLVVKPVGNLTQAVETLAGGNTAITVPATNRGDELGVMARAVEFFRQKLVEIEELRRKTMDAEKDAAEARRRGMLELADSFEASVKGVVQAVSAS
ncbi:MAG: HAMP domain-containing protein, partial [Rhodospirillaceae bacterium]|nr:HAMP domain-containing protein [Rhodospirillaceae bacterium]